MIDLKRDLNERQHEAARHVSGPLLVIAGAGSGKTRVITYRVANLVQKHRVDPRRILAVTFTNKAAREMRERVCRLLGGEGQDCWISTFHATCAKLLRFHGEMAGINPQFTIYDDGDQKAMVTRCLKELNFSDKSMPPRAIQSEINRSKRELTSAEEYPASDFYRERIKQVYNLYEKRMRDASALDFADLLYATVRTMKENKEFRHTINRRFDYILVDEFQDTNYVQLELTRFLAEPHQNICVVGDDDQSIYSWRGADVRNILEFERFFPGAKLVTLDRNYRSTGNILKGAHGVVSPLPDRRDKKLWTSADDGERLSVICARDEREEARLVARAIKELQDDGHPLDKQAVFYRINAQSRVFEEVFRTMGIPYRVVGGMRFYERAEVKDVLAYLRVIQNPGDLAAFLRVINTPTRGIGKTTVEKLVALAAGRGVSAYEAIVYAREEIGGAAGKRLNGFRDLVEDWRAELELGPTHLAARVLEDTGFLTGLQAENSADADARIENLTELMGSIEDFEDEMDEPSLSSFLELVALQTDIDTVKFEGEEATLMTVHAAKGLEFDVVHLTGLEEDLFPFRRTGELESSSAEAMDEERRLCYVAMTRARKRLLLNYTQARRIFGKTRINRPSRFLGDIPRDLIQDLTPQRPSVESLDRRTAISPVWRGGDGARSPASSYKAPVHRANAPVHRANAGTGGKPRPKNELWVDRSFDQTSDSNPIHIGQTVRNSRYGVGKVVGLKSGARPKAEVDFPVYGKKLIIIDFLDFD